MVTDTSPWAEGAAGGGGPRGGGGRRRRGGAGGCGAGGGGSPAESRIRRRIEIPPWFADEGVPGSPLRQPSGKARKRRRAGWTAASIFGSPKPQAAGAISSPSSSRGRRVRRRGALGGAS